MLERLAAFWQGLFAQRIRPKHTDGMRGLPEIDPNEPLRKGEILLSKAEADAWNRARENRLSTEDRLGLIRKELKAMRVEIAASTKLTKRAMKCLKK